MSALTDILMGYRARARSNPSTPIREIIATQAAIDTKARRDYLRKLIQKHAPVDTGALRDSFNDPRTVQIKPTGVVEIDNPLKYARIQDKGGTIPPYDIVKEKGPGHVMRAKIAGKIRFFTKRRAFNIKAQRYVAKAIREYNRSPLGAVAPVHRGGVGRAFSLTGAAILAAIAALGLSEREAA